MLTSDELRNWVSHFGVPEQQVRRDHLISHALHVALVCPTGPAAAAIKLNAWAERATPRDLCDLAGLATAGLFGADAIAIAADAGLRPALWMFDDDRIPTETAWQAALGHQMAEPMGPATAMHKVRAAILGH